MSRALLIACVAFGCASARAGELSPEDAALDRCIASAPAPNHKACVKQLCQDGNLVACDYYASEFWEDDPAAAAALAARVCKSGLAHGCGTQAEVLRDSAGAARRAPDEKKISALFKLACDGGNAKSCCELSARYEEGRGVPKDPRRAEELRVLADKHFPCGKSEPIPDWLKAKPATKKR